MAMAWNRREFLEITAGSLAAAAGVRTLAQSQTAPEIAVPSITSMIAGVPLGCGSISFQQFPIEEVPALMKRVGYGLVEVLSSHVEPRQPGGAGRGRGADPDARARQREWRLTTPMSYFEGIGKRFHDAGIYVYSTHMVFGADAIDEEIDRYLQATRAMGGQVMTTNCPQTNEFARRLDVQARKNRMRVGIHNTGIATIVNEAAWDTLLGGCSDYVGINLDIGHYARTGNDPVELIRRKRHLVVDIHVKPRQGGPPTTKVPPDGDDTVKSVLVAMRDNKWVIPSNLEHEGPPMSDADKIAAITEWFAYERAVLEGKPL